MYCLLYSVPDFRNCDNMPGGNIFFLSCFNVGAQTTADSNGVIVPVSERIRFKIVHCAPCERQLLLQQTLLNN